MRTTVGRENEEAVSIDLRELAHLQLARLPDQAQFDVVGDRQDIIGSNDNVTGHRDAGGDRVAVIADGGLDGHVHVDASGPDEFLVFGERLKRAGFAGDEFRLQVDRRGAVEAGNHPE